MSDEGEEIRSLFEEVYLGELGSDVVVYRDWNSPSMTSFETRARKDQERGITFFEFKLGAEVYTGDVIQIVNGRDFWRVVDVEEEVQLGTRIKNVARVTKINQQGTPIQLDSEGRAVHYTTNIHGPNYGGIQQGGQGNVQNITLTNNPDFDRAVASLVELIRNSSIPEDDKEDIRGDIDKVSKLALKEPAPGLLGRAKNRLDLIKVAVTGTDIAIKASPHIDTLWEMVKQRFGG
jgi:hypothetical protein